MGLMQERHRFESEKKIYESVKVVFKGVDGFDVYNPSIPFVWEGRSYIFGRVERRSEWARSWVRLFEKSGPDEWTLVPSSMIYQLEDPYVSIVGKELVMGGTHVQYRQGEIDTFFGYFYRGTDLADLRYFTTGPSRMKDIRIVAIPGGRIGVFSRPRGEAVRMKYGSESLVGFTTVNNLLEINADLVENAPIIPDLFGKDEWGGGNQAYVLDSGLIGVIGHKCYMGESIDGVLQQTYMNFAFVFDPETLKLKDQKLIGTRSCYPDGPAKKPDLYDCVFTSGIVQRADGRVDLYSGIGDCEVGRLTIDNPFKSFGNIIGYDI